MLNVDLERRRQWELGDLRTQMIGTRGVLLDEQEHKLAGKLGLVRECGFERDDGRTWLAAGVATGASEAVNVHDPLVERTENREPSVQILAKDLVLRGRMALDRPDGLFGNSHGN